MEAEKLVVAVWGAIVESEIVRSSRIAAAFRWVLSNESLLGEWNLFGDPRGCGRTSMLFGPIKVTRTTQTQLSSCTKNLDH